MELALLGADPDSIGLATAAQDSGHTLVWAGDFAWASQQWPGAWPADADRGADWEALLDGGFCAAVIVGRGSVSSDLRQEQLAQLVKNGIAVLSTFPLFDSVLSYYEIDMIRCESGSLLMHYNPLAMFGGPNDFGPLRERLDLGRIEQVRWERPLSDRSRENVVRHFARDVAILESVAGRLDRLGAHGSSDQSATYSGLSVQLIGHKQIPVQWSVRPETEERLAKLSIIAEQGEAQASFGSSGSLIHFGIDFTSGDSEASSIQPLDPKESAIRQLESALQTGDQQSTWPDALHAMELADTIEISLRRSRMIDIHPQQLTEELAFKGTMSAVGCGVLMVLPPLLLFLGWIADLAGLPIAGYWKHALLLVLSLFLAIQFLPKLLAAPSSKSSVSSPDNVD